VVLLNRKPLKEIDAFLAEHWAPQMTAGKKIEHFVLFGPVSVVGGGSIFNAVLPPLPTCNYPLNFCSGHPFERMP
jgi:hypothetical protein